MGYWQVILFLMWCVDLTMACGGLDTFGKLGSSLTSVFLHVWDGYGICSSNCRSSIRLCVVFSWSLSLLQWIMLYIFRLNIEFNIYLLFRWVHAMCDLDLFNDYLLPSWVHVKYNLCSGLDSSSMGTYYNLLFPWSTCNLIVISFCMVNLVVISNDLSYI